MATIKDIARLAGVSHGTVSNVINKKGNVSSDKIKLVEEAARTLGFAANAQAQRLRKEDNRHIAVLMPDLYTEQYCVFYTALSQRLQLFEYGVSLHLTQASTKLEQDCVENAMTRCPTAIVSVAPTPTFIDTCHFHIPVILVDAPLSASEGTKKYFGFNYGEIAREIFEKKLTNQQCIAFFGDSKNSSSDRMLSQTLQQLCERTKKELLDFSYERRFIHLGALELSERAHEYTLLIVTSPERLRIVAEVFQFKGQPLPETVLLSPKHFIPNDRAFAYELDYTQLGICLAEQLNTVKITEFPICTAFSPSGFRFSFSNLHIHPKEQTLSLLTLSSPTTASISKLITHFKQTTGIRLKITMLPYDELLNTLSSFGANRHDLVRMDMAWRARFERQVCQPLRGCIPEIEGLWQRFLPALKTAYQSDYTLPIDPSVQILLYRKDLFEDATLRRLYYEINRDTLEPPSTLEKFHRIARFFTKSYNPGSPIEYGTVSNHGLSTVAACDFLPYFKSMGGELFDSQGHFCINAPPMCAALKSYLETASYSSPEELYWWSDSVAQFTQGKASMISIFSNHATSAVSNQNASAIALAGCAPVPGMKPCLGGGCIGISAASKQRDLCLEFFKWLYSDEIAGLITLSGGMTPVSCAFQDEQLRALYPWLETMDQHFSAGHRQNSSPLYPHFDNYRFEIILGAAVRNVVMGLTNLEEAMEMMQTACEQQFS